MNDPLGVDAGSLGSLESMGLTNEYKDIPDQSLDAIADRVNPNQVASGMTRGIQQLGSEKVYSDGGNNQIIVEDANEPRVLMGDQATFGEGFYVTKDGFNAKTETNAANFIFNSSQNMFKIVSTGTAIVTVPTPISSGTVLTTTVAHNLGVKPAFSAFVDIPIGDGSAVLQGKLTGVPAFLIKSTGSISIAATVDVDTTNIYFRVANTAGTGVTGVDGVWTFKYYLLTETAN